MYTDILKSLVDSNIMPFVYHYIMTITADIRVLMFLTPDARIKSLPFLILTVSSPVLPSLACTVYSAVQYSAVQCHLLTGGSEAGTHSGRDGARWTDIPTFIPLREY